MATMAIAICMTREVSTVPPEADIVQERAAYWRALWLSTGAEQWTACWSGHSD